MIEPSDERNRMVDETIVGRGIGDERVIAAMRRVPRHDFVPPELAARAYSDAALPIGRGSTISQPYIVALTLDALALGPDDRVLDVGTGSGYVAALLAELVAHVTTIEYVAPLAEMARRRLARYGDRIEVVVGDGSQGWPANAPYDAIAVAAAAPVVPEPLVEQLALGGRLVVPVGNGPQQLVMIERAGQGEELTVLADVRFVPLVGRYGH